MKFDVEFFRKYVQKTLVSLKSGKNNGYFIWRLFTFLKTSRWILLRMRNVSDKSSRENQKTHFIFNNLSSNLAVYEVMSKNMVEPERPHMIIITCMRLACWVSKIYTRLPTHTHAFTHASRRALTQRNILYSLHFQSKRASIVRTLPVLLNTHYGLNFVAVTT
jgi:hypothetical protein